MQPHRIFIGLRQIEGQMLSPAGRVIVLHIRIAAGNAPPIQQRMF